VLSHPHAIPQSPDLLVGLPLAPEVVHHLPAEALQKAAAHRQMGSVHCPQAVVPLLLKVEVVAVRAEPLGLVLQWPVARDVQVK